MAARSGFYFDDPMREAIHRLKYHGKTALAPRLAPLLVDTLRFDAVLKGFKPDWIVPIPLHPRRFRQRGYNQSFLLARELGRSMKTPVAQVLLRKRDTTPQVGLKRADRAKNIKGAFSLDADAFAKVGGAGRSFLLIDDVFTTGATLDEAAHTLRKAGAAQVCALTLARQV
jgi:ComF family protein